MSKARRPAADAGWWQPDPVGTKPYRGVVRTSRYLSMRDGCRIAIDLYLPKMLDTGGRLPTILRQTRYFRRTVFHPVLNWFLERRNRIRRAIHRFVERGYALVNVDARGSGASFGSRQMEWSPDEVRDGAEIVDWIVAQPWSNGVVGTLGISYNGTAAEMAVTNCHPALRAAAIQFALFDIYPDVLCPGGVHNQSFMRTWATMNQALDWNALAAFTREQISPWLGRVIQGVAPVDEDAAREMLQAAVQEHEDNYDIYETSRQIEFRDDVTAAGLALDTTSPHAHLDALREAGLPLYSWSSWFDGAYPRAAIARYLNVRTPGSRLILGPWDHGAMANPDPHAPDRVVRFDLLGELDRFFDYHLKGFESGIEDEPPVFYYTMGEEAWKSSDTWPPPGFQPVAFYFAEHGSLQRDNPPDAEGADLYRVDPTTGSGVASRWMSLVNVANVPIGYPDRAQRDRELLVYTSAPLARDAEMTGHPLVTLHVRCSAPDATLFVYLEDVLPNGEVYYVTEGVFRAIHRRIDPGPGPYELPVPYHTFRRGDARPLAGGEVAEVTFDLLPVSYLFRRGHAIRIAIAGADADNFALIPPTPPEIEVMRSPAYPSHVTLPIADR